MRLLLDFGNTLVKIAFFSSDKLLDLIVSGNISPRQLSRLIEKTEQKHPTAGIIKYAMLSSVRRIPKGIEDFLTGRFKLIILGHNTPLPITIDYKTPETLGRDRIALAVAGSGMFPGENILVIDAGTCITYDFVNRNGGYEGGGISPGLLMRFKALHTFTDKLPLIKKFGDTGLIGNSTNSSIISGVLNGAIAEVDYIINRYRKEYAVSKIILTGGDMIYFEKKLKNNIFANSNLVLEGLNMILNYNVEN
ncbi:MAG: type III pantothenate kinase [Bacteroidetes bacterium]|nr:type III pantothenate kinase [Bacteroidota bacterium]